MHNLFFILYLLGCSVAQLLSYSERVQSLPKSSMVIILEPWKPILKRITASCFVTNLLLKIIIKMIALILVGGYGTRLRPLTFSCPKSIIPFANKPMIEHQIEALSKVGCRQVILAINYQADKITEGLKDMETKYGIKITCSRETEALGTAGPIRLAKDYFKDAEYIFVFNSDIVCDYPLNELLNAHKSNGKEGTIVLTQVMDPSRFGVVVTGENGQVQKFVQKPKEFVSNKINAGVYLLNKSAVDRIPQGFCMIETGVFPKMATEGQLYSVTLKDNFWNDVGQPKDYLIGQEQFLKYYKVKAEGENYQGNVMVDPTAKVSPKAIIGPNVVIGAGCVIQDGVRIKDSVLFQNTTVQKGSWIDNALISWNVKIGAWVRIQGLTVIAQHVTIGSELRVTETRIMSQKQVKANVEKGTILM